MNSLYSRPHLLMTLRMIKKSGKVSLETFLLQSWIAWSVKVSGYPMATRGTQTVGFQVLCFAKQRRNFREVRREICYRVTGGSCDRSQAELLSSRSRPQVGHCGAFIPGNFVETEVRREAGNELVSAVAHPGDIQEPFHDFKSVPGREKVQLPFQCTLVGRAKDALPSRRRAFCV